MNAFDSGAEGVIQKKEKIRKKLNKILDRTPVRNKGALTDRGTLNAKMMSSYGEYGLIKVWWVRSEHQPGIFFGLTSLKWITSFIGRTVSYKSYPTYGFRQRAWTWRREITENEFCLSKTTKQQYNYVFWLVCGITFYSSFSHLRHLLLPSLCISCLSRDDTILASTVLCTNGVTLSSPTVPDEIVQQFESLQDQIIKIFDVAFSYTKNVFVITNAEVSIPLFGFFSHVIFQRGWVELSAQQFMPRVYQKIEKLNIVVSARTTYQGIYPNRPDMVCLFFTSYFVFIILSLDPVEKDGLYRTNQFLFWPRSRWPIRPQQC